MLTSRLSHLKKLLGENNADAALISSLPNIAYLTDFYHFNDIERDAFLLLTKKNNYIFTNPLYSLAVKTHLKKITLLEISMNNSFTKLLGEVIKKEKIKILGLEENNITVSEYKIISPLTEQTKSLNLRSLRAIKSTDEIEKIKKACAIGDKAFTSLLKEIKLGTTEKQVALRLETYFRNYGAVPSFPTIVAFQENAAVPHHKTGDKKLKKNELILIDSGVKYQEYCSDMTRTFFFGKATEEQKKAYEMVSMAQQKAISYIIGNLSKKIEIKGSEVDKTARDFTIKTGYPSFGHGLGHGVGLQLHEPPRLSPLSKDILTEGMAFSIEPGIYLPDKFGVRIEDLFTIVNNKLVQLTKSPNKLLEI